MGPLIGKVDADAVHTVDLAQRAFDPADTGGAGHPVDVQLQGLHGDAIAGLFDGLHQGWQAAFGGLHARQFSGQVHTDSAGAGDFAQGPLDSPGAAGAGHAGNR
ncbi:hypothetical protein D3C80_2006010 [compost metagenome]